MDKSRTNSRHKKKAGKAKGNCFQELTVKQVIERQRMEGAVGRFSDSSSIGYYSYGTGLKSPTIATGRIRSHPRETVRMALQLTYKFGWMKAAAITEVPFATVKYWYQRRFLPKTGPYTFEKMLELIRDARREYLITRFKPITCVQHAIDRTGTMRWRTVKQYLYLQAMPTVPGFPLYADRMVNDKAELYGRGERKFSAVLGVEPPDKNSAPAGPESHTKQTVPKVAPRQKGRRFLVELSATGRLPQRSNDLL
jgi:hypothetical protein